MCDELACAGLPWVKLPGWGLPEVLATAMSLSTMRILSAADELACVGLPWVKLPGWGLPEVEVQALATAIRRAARLLWSLHLCFVEGFDLVRSASGWC